MFLLEKNYLRCEQGLLDSLAELETLWQQVQANPEQDTVRNVEFSRRAAALTAVARWACFSALHCTGTFLDHRLVEYLAAIPPSMQQTLFWDKKIIREAPSGQGRRQKAFVKWQNGYQITWLTAKNIMEANRFLSRE